MSNISFENAPEPSMNHSMVTRIEMQKDGQLFSDNQTSCQSKDLGTKKIHQNETQYVVLESRKVNQ